MKIVCCYCGVGLGHKAPLDDPSLTHGMCPACDAHCRRLWQGIGLGRYLDQFAVPVLVVDADERPLAANAAMIARGFDIRRCGDDLTENHVVECERARLPGGCGCELHCYACAVRINIGHTLATGAARERVPATLMPSRDDEAELWISTRREGEVVYVVVESRDAGA